MAQMRVNVPNTVRSDALYLAAFHKTHVPDVLGRLLVWLHNSYSLDELAAIVGAIDLDLVNVGRGAVPEAREVKP